MSNAGRRLRQGILALLVVMLLAGVTAWLSKERIYARLLEAAGARAGLTLSAGGLVVPGLWPVVTVAATGLDAAPTGADGWDARLQQARLEIDARSLLSGKLVIEAVEVQGARLRLDRTSADAPVSVEAITALARARVSVADARIDIETGAASKPHVVQIERYGSGPGPNGHPRIEARGTVDGSALTVDAQFGVSAERIGDGMAFPLTASVSVPGWKLQGSVKGHVAQPLAGKGLALEAALESSDAAPLAAILGLPEVLAGRLTIAATLDGDLPSPRLTKLDAKLNNGDALAAHVEGSGIELASGDIESLQLSYQGPLPADALETAEAVQHVSIDASLKGTPGRYMVDVRRLQVTLSAGKSVDAHGTLELVALDDWAAARSRLDVKADVAEAGAVAGRLAGHPLPDLGRAELRGHLTGPLSGATLGKLELRLGGKGPVQITVRGQLGPLRLDADAAALLSAVAIDVTVDAAVRDGKLFQGYADGALSKLAPWSARGRVRADQAKWRLDGLTVSAGRERAVRIQASGEAGGRGALAAGVQRLVAGTLDKGDTARLDVTVETADARATAWLTGINVPELGAIKGHARLQAESREIAVRGLKLESTGPLACRLAGDIGAVKGLRDVDLELVLAPTPPEVIDRLLDLELPLVGAMSIEAKLRRPGQQALSVDGEARVGSSRFALELSAERTATVPLIKGRIHSKSIRADDFWQFAAAATPPAATPEKKPAPAPARKKASPSGGLGLLAIIPGLDFVLQDAVEQEEQARVKAVGTPEAGEALPWSRLSHVDIDLDVHADTVHGWKSSAGPLDLRLVDRAGRLVFGPLKLVGKDGSLTLQGVADSNADPPSLTAEGRGQGLLVAELVAISGLDPGDVAGKLSFDYALRSQGQSLIQLRAGLAGTIRSLVEHGRLPVRDLDLLSGSLLDWVTSWTAPDKQTPVPCAIADFTIKDGLATAKTLYLKTDGSAAYGIGNIDLRSDSLDIKITPKLSGLHLSVPATVRIHGPLAAPEMEVVDPEAVVAHYGIQAAEAFEFLPSLLLRPFLQKLKGSDTSTPCR